MTLPHPAPSRSRLVSLRATRRNGVLPPVSRSRDSCLSDRCGCTGCHGDNAEGGDGYVVVEQSDKGIALFKRLYSAGESLAKNELRLRYRIRNGAVKFATNAFFFEEGQGEVYQSARYGQFRVNDVGELLLAGMYDKDLTKLESTALKTPKN